MKDLDGKKPEPWFQTNQLNKFNKVFKIDAEIIFL